MSQSFEKHVQGFQKAAIFIMALETVQHRAAKALKPFETHDSSQSLLGQGMLMVA